MGKDGHTASLFPGTTALDETTALVCAPFVASMSVYRIALTFPVLNAARDVLFLVAGADKALALSQVRSAAALPAALPAARVQPKDGRLRWFVDDAAAVGS